MSIESMLRETLHSYAGEAQRDAGLLDAAVARSRRRRRRRLAAGAGVAVVAVAATALAVPATVGGEPDAFEPAFSGGVGLEPPEYELPQFPFTPGWEPPEADNWYVDLRSYGEIRSVDPSTAVVTAGEPSLRLVHEDDDRNPWVETRVSATPIAPPPAEDYEPDPVAEPATVQGRDATLYTAGESPMEVTWRHRPHMWVSVTSYGATTAGDLLHYAEELVEEPTPVNPFFRFDLVPIDSELVTLEPSIAAFGLPWTSDHDPVGEVGVLLVGDAPADIHDVGESIQVGGRDGVLLRDGRLVVFLDNGLVLAVGAVGDLQLSREDLIRFAAGVHVSSDAKPASGPVVPFDAPPD